MKSNTGMTIYNKYVSSGTEKYQRTQITNVQWENTKASNILASGVLEANKFTIYISFNGHDANYLLPKAWLALATKTGKFTLNEGDVIVKGLITDEITSTPTVFTISDLKAKYDNVAVIKSVDTYDLGSYNMNHWQLGAT
jgi:hypothetical protein